MFKAGRWRSDKNRNKITAVFELQFKVTQVSEKGWELMMVAINPTDAGKGTRRSEKAPVIDGECTWKPFYETVKLTHDPKTGRHGDRVYEFVVSATGRSKYEQLGEITINFADCTQLFKPSSGYFSKASSSGAILHMTLHRIRGDGEGRDADDGHGDAAVRRNRVTLQTQLSDSDGKGRAVSNGIDDMNFVEVQRPVNFNGKLRKTSSLDAVSASGSETSSGQFTPKENEIKNSDVSQDSVRFVSHLVNNTTRQMPRTSSIDSATNTDWSLGSAPNGSMGGSTNSSGETGLRERFQESGDGVDNHRTDVPLKRQLEVSDLEVQTLRKQVVKENKRGQELFKELSGVKEERDALRREIEELRASQNQIFGTENVPDKPQFCSVVEINNHEENLSHNQSISDENISNKLQFDKKVPWWSAREEIIQELNHEKNLSANLRLQLQKTQEANSELILAVRDLEEMLEQKNSEISCVSCSTKNSEMSCISYSTTTVKPGTSTETKETEVKNELSHLQNSDSAQEQGHELYGTSSENGEQFALDILVKDPYGIKGAGTLEQKIIDLNSMVELYRRYREDTEMQMEQLALDYEILKQENHDLSSKLEQAKLQEQLRMQYECSSHLTIISDLEAQVESLEKELDNQAKAFASDLETVTNSKVEQELRALRAEEAVRKTRWTNANTAQHLQEEFKALSGQISSTFHVNEKLLMQALAESNELHSQKSHLEELLRKSNKELASVKGQCRVKFQQLLSLVDLKTKEADRLSEELKAKHEEIVNKKNPNKKWQLASSEELLINAEMEMLCTEKNPLAEQVEQPETLVAEIEEMKVLIEQSTKLLQERDTERNILQMELASLREEKYISAEELLHLKHELDEKELMIETSNSEGNLFDRRYGNKPEDENVITSNSEEISSELQKEYRGEKTAMNANSNSSRISEEYLLQTRTEDKTCEYCTSDINRELITRNHEASADKQEEHSASGTCKKIDEVLSEMVFLKEINQSMEAELKDMQERYSDISLKFAEVEGERQQLVMTIRTLRNANKNSFW